MKPKKVGKPKIEGLKIQAKIDEKQLEFAKKNNEGKSSAEIVRMGIEALNNGFEKNIDVLTLHDNIELLEVYSGGYYENNQGITLYNRSKKENFKELGVSIECDSITQLKGDKFKIILKKEDYLSVYS